MAFIKKSWVDRLSQFPARRQLVNTTSAGVYDIVRQEGTVTNEGDRFDASTMNDLENRVNNAFSELDTTYSEKSIEVLTTLITTNWTGATAPFQYVLGVTGVTAVSNQDIGLQANQSTDVVTSWSGANIQDAGQSANTVVLNAYGDKPTIDIPIRVILRKDT